MVNTYDVEIITTFMNMAEAVVLRQAPTCDVVYDEMHESEYCRVCEIGSLISLINHELEEMEQDYASP